ncbi:MAG: type I restriction endonuclease subunit R, partial [Erysipelothrix sp.]|nr:type I restriction endonuclease subunit R [Erysipelothrix sp.]
IADGNVLGFHVDYINTGEFISHDDLRKQIVDRKILEKPDIPLRDLERSTILWSDKKVEEESSKMELLVYQDETHIPRVVNEILDNWKSQSQDRHFNAILTVAYKNRVMAYYDEFIRQLSNNDYKINVAMTFSFGGDSEVDETPIEIIETMFKDYSDFTGIEFSYGDQKKGEDAYFEDLVDRSTRGGSNRNSKNIDLIIVAEQLLTGYDNKYLNTLYVDRMLKKQGLIQAYSRTNRVYGKEKEFGSIINFKYPAISEDLVSTALKLYGSGGKSSRAIVEHYETAVDKFSIKVTEMKDALNDPTDWENFKNSNKEKDLFTLSFKDAHEQLRLVMQYYEYKWDDSDFGLSEHTWLKYVGAYKNLTYEDKEEDGTVVLNPLVGKTKLSQTQIIDADHILNLIGGQIKSVKGIKTVDAETLRIIHEEIQELSDMGDSQQAILLKEFVDTELVTGKLSNDLNFDEQFENWKNSRMSYEVERFAKEWGIDDSILHKSVERFFLAREDEIPYIDEISQSINYDNANNKEAGSHLGHVMKVINKKLPEWIIKAKKKYF